MNFWNRVGTFLLVIGVILGALFLFSDLAGVAQIKFLLWGMAGMVSGALIKWNKRPPPREPSGRFRLIKQVQQKNGERKQKRQKKV